MEKSKCKDKKQHHVGKVISTGQLKGMAGKWAFLLYKITVF